MRKVQFNTTDAWGNLHTLSLGISVKGNFYAEVHFQGRNMSILNFTDRGYNDRPAVKHELEMAYRKYHNKRLQLRTWVQEILPKGGWI
ncbi:hypothetical protein NVP2117O_06 [Vibrio phage 2.117.O._10N.261.45.E9]|nr:hypothetical protein NVP1117O_06 [Vibrio phage 1.117.O._10N.261.45.E9]AUR95488.1 hypothetical protein NVP1207B_81 [Vibrio phage 1.207.B._10N.222.51.C2]AUS02298.1 hypothetical protein NVP2117O_06 [Vibrio phage 2.117.O._10N.261.45.E9]